MKNCFIEVESFQKSKDSEYAYGDRFFSAKDNKRNRIIAVLSDGLGSGVKANVLSTLTGSMLMKFLKDNRNIKLAASIIMRTLPVCKERQISYSTFTAVDVSNDLTVRIIEYDNPPALLIRNNKIISLDRTYEEITDSIGKIRKVAFSTFNAEVGDRIIVCSDGVSQSAMGTPFFPLGWGSEGIKKYALDLIEKNSAISARDMSQSIVRKAWYHDNNKAADDITCGALYFREPRNLILATGPSYFPERDADLCQTLKNFPGKKIICGGTTANIVARELNKKIKVIIGRDNFDPDIPPHSEMEGIDLVTEGIITLGHVITLLKEHSNGEYKKKSPATMLVEILLDSDIVYFLVGTRINEAHQNPNVPVEIEIRRNVIKKIAKILETEYLKQVHLQYI